VDAQNDNRRPRSSAVPSLLGSGPAPAAKPDELKILSVLQAPSSPRPRAGKLLPLSLGAVAAAGVAYAVWQFTAAAPAEVIMAAVPAAVSSASAAASAPAVREAAASAPATGTNAALIENVPASAASATAPAAAPALAVAAATAAAVASPLAALTTSEPAASAALPVAASAPKAVKAAKTARRGHMQTASAKRTKPVKKKSPDGVPAKAAPGKDADVDLLEAMVAHVRGKNAAATGKAQPAPAVDAPKR
jgi:hypothetical protein